MTYIQPAATPAISGGTLERPVGAPTGHLYYDSDLDQVILWDGVAWVNLDGTDLGGDPPA